MLHAIGLCGWAKIYGFATATALQFFCSIFYDMKTLNADGMHGMTRVCFAVILEINLIHQLFRAHVLR